MRVKFGCKGYSSFAAINVHATDKMISDGAFFC